jgi:hypothetical protein
VCWIFFFKNCSVKGERRYTFLYEIINVAQYCVTIDVFFYEQTSKQEKNKNEL